MRRMNEFEEEDEFVQIPSTQYTKLLKYKQSYLQLCNDIANCFSFDARGRATNLDITRMKALLRPFAESLYKSEYR